VRSRPATSLGHQGGEEFAGSGPNFLNYVLSNTFKLCPTYFSRGGEKFSSGVFAPLVTGVVRQQAVLNASFHVGGPLSAGALRPLICGVKRLNPFFRLAYTRPVGYSINM